jgi:hypothetical protein
LRWQLVRPDGSAFNVSANILAERGASAVVIVAKQAFAPERSFEAIALRLAPRNNGNGAIVLTVGRRTNSGPVIVDEPENMLGSVDGSAWRSLGLPLII